MKIDASFKFEGGKKRYETPKAWAEVKIAKDRRRGDYYIDVVMGVRGKGAHVHLGLNGDGTRRFVESRGRLNSLSQRAVDSNLALVDDRTVNFKPEAGENSLTFTVLVTEKTRTIKVIFEDGQLSSPQA